VTPIYENGNVRAPCPDCDGAVTTFEMRLGGNEHGTVAKPGRYEHDGHLFERTLYILLRCASCGRGGLATVTADGQVAAGTLLDFYPLSRETAKLPVDVPPDVVAEYREAELCASVGAWRAGSALLRSALEKTLKANGYTKGKLFDKIDMAAADGVITGARQKRAHEQVRDLGNDILHDDWRPVTEPEYASAHHYVQRILEDFYDDRTGVEALLIGLGRLPDPAASGM
jgi:hypothetical protein